MRRVEIAGVQRVWALSVFAVLTPSQRDHPADGQRHPTRLDWVRQRLNPVRRWRFQGTIVRVADLSFAALEWLKALRPLPRFVPVGTRLRLDAARSNPLLSDHRNQGVAPHCPVGTVSAIASLSGCSALDGWVGKVSPYLCRGARPRALPVLTLPDFSEVSRHPRLGEPTKSLIRWRV